jgi:hypothetical protein
MQANEYVPYRRKALYLIITLPMIALYIAVAIMLWRNHPAFFTGYAALFVLVAIFQSYVCVYWQCPYVGRFAPCVGGFCLPSSRIARLMKNVNRSKTLYNIFLSLAYASFFGIILYPVYFLYQQGIVLVLGYAGIVLAYSAVFMLWVCPVCATKSVCPGGQTAVSMRSSIDKLLSGGRKQKQ